MENIDNSLEPEPSRIRKVGRWLKKEVPKHLANSTGICVAATPLFTSFEYLTDISRDTSESARLLALYITYGGFGHILGTGQDAFRKLITSDKLWMRGIKDSLSAGAINLVFAPFFYKTAEWLGGESHSWEDIAWGAAIATGLAIGGGWLYGIARDVYKDLWQIEPYEHMPRFIERQNKWIKRGISVGLATVSLAATLGIYAIYPPSKNDTPEHPAPIVQYETIDSTLTR